MPRPSTGGGAPAAGPYARALIAFGTMHGKQHQVAGSFAGILHTRMVAPVGIDTDQFGTFAGEIPRTLTPIQAARAKARLAMTAVDTPYGLASEASYGPLPGLPVPGHEEMLLFLDDTRGIEILEGERSLDVPWSPRRVTDTAEAAAFLAGVGFPAQAVIVHAAQGPAGLALVKGIADLAALAHAITSACQASPDGHAVVEADLRAQHNPTRRRLLTRLGQRLAHRLAIPCPACRCPGYGRTGTEPGLPCAACDTPTHLAAADVHSCARCPHRHRVPRPDLTADPQWCDRCNP
ncbi:MAG: hypothetical protein LH461_02715 [Spirochaetaceae bacterium]|nr:hypothetical protein [Spirochaetaceae bacterium]